MKKRGKITQPNVFIPKDLVEHLGQCHGIDALKEVRDMVAQEIQRQSKPAMDTAEPNITASEAIFGFCAWLTSRKQTTIMGASYECGCIPELIGEWCVKNNLPEPRTIFPRNITQPKND